MEYWVILKTATEQVISGGATVTSYNLGITNSTVNSITIDSGKCPLQYITNNGAFTCTAPSNDGSCIVQILNGTSANTITFSGWQVNIFQELEIRILLQMVLYLMFKY